MDLIIKEFSGDNTPEERGAHQANLDSALEERDKDKFDRELSSVSKLEITNYASQNDFESLSFVTDAMKTNSSVHSLTATRFRGIEGSPSDDNVRDATLIADMLEENKGIKELDLSHNQFYDKSMGKIGTALQTNRTLETISFVVNNETPDKNMPSKGTIDAWRNVIQHNDQLTNIDLSDNSQISDDFCQEAIVPALKERKTPLKHLDLSSNDLDEGIAAALLEAVTINTNIGVVDISSEILELGVVTPVVESLTSSLINVGKRNIELLELQNNFLALQQQLIEQETTAPAIEDNSLNRKPQARKRAGSYAEEEAVSKKSRSESYGR